MSREYTVYQGDQVIGHGTFYDEALLRRDYPSPAYTLVLDKIILPKAKELTYAELRHKAYPPVEVFQDAVYWQSKGDNTKMDAYLAACEEVKARYPKPV